MLFLAHFYTSLQLNVAANYLPSSPSEHVPVYKWSLNKISKGWFYVSGPFLGRASANINEKMAD